VYSGERARQMRSNGAGAVYCVHGSARNGTRGSRRSDAASAERVVLKLLVGHGRELDVVSTVRKLSMTMGLMSPGPWPPRSVSWL
jgi:hypothetical protein